MFQLLLDFEASHPAISCESGHSSLNDPDSVQLVFLLFNAMVCIYVFPQKPSKTEQLATTGFTPLEIMSFKVMVCLTYDPHPSDPYKSGFQEGNSLMIHLQTSPLRRKGKSFMSSLSPVLITCRAGIRPFAGRAGEVLGLGTAEFLQ